MVGVQLLIVEILYLFQGTRSRHYQCDRSFKCIDYQEHSMVAKVLRGNCKVFGKEFG